MRDKASHTRDTMEEKGSAPNGQHLSSDPRDIFQSGGPLRLACSMQGLGTARAGCSSGMPLS